MMTRIAKALLLLVFTIMVAFPVARAGQAPGPVEQSVPPMLAAASMPSDCCLASGTAMPAGQHYCGEDCHYLPAANHIRFHAHSLPAARSRDGPLPARPVRKHFRPPIRL